MTTRTQRFLLLLVAALCFGGAASAHEPEDFGYRSHDRRLQSPWSRVERREDHFVHGAFGCDSRGGCRVRSHWARWQRHHHRHGWSRGCGR